MVKRESQTVGNVTDVGAFTVATASAVTTNDVTPFIDRPVNFAVSTHCV